MLPTMPRCASSAAFNSARLADVYSAFFLLVAGMVIAISIGIFERIWNNRKQMRETVMRGIRKHNPIPHFHFHHHHVDHHDRLDARQPHLHVAAPIGKLRSYDPGYLTMLQNHAHQVQSLVGFQKRDVSPEKPRGPALEPRLRQRSIGPKRASWSSFSGFPKKKKSSTEGTSPTSNAKNVPIFPFRD